jgi:hypothetical protein
MHESKNSKTLKTVYQGRSYDEASEAVASVKFQIYIYIFSFLQFFNKNANVTHIFSFLSHIRYTLSLIFLCQNVQNCYNFTEINMSQMPLKTGWKSHFRGSVFQKISKHPGNHFNLATTLCTLLLVLLNMKVQIEKYRNGHIIIEIHK